MSLDESLSETGKSGGLTRESVGEKKPIDYAPLLKKIERVIEKTNEQIQSKATGRKYGAKNTPSSSPTATKLT